MKIARLRSLLLPSVGSSEHKNVGRRAHDLASEAGFGFRFENSLL